MTKQRIILALTLLSGLLYAQQWPRPKLWVSIQFKDEGDRVLFIQDLETGTRCYAVTSNVSTSSGYGISCVKDGK